MKFTDPTGLADEDNTIKYTQDSFKINYFETNNQNDPISVEFDGKSYTLGEDLNFGDMIPFDAKFNVPKDSVLEIDNGSVDLRMTNIKDFSVGPSLDTYNTIVSSAEFRKAMNKDKLLGGVMMTGGAVLFGGSIYLASTVPANNMGPQAMVSYMGMKTGGSLFCFGLARVLGSNKRQIVEDLRDSFVPAEITAYESHARLRR